MKKALRNNGLSIVLVGFFLLFWIAQAVTGYQEHAADETIHGQASPSFLGYLSSAHFFEATFENWESEFLQMSAYVVLTVFLYQRGSAESKDPDPVKASRHRTIRSTPLPRRQWGWRLKLYEHSLSLTLFGLFLISWMGHAVAGLANYNNEQAEHGLPPISFLEYLSTSRLWFESFQNWQSEFLAVAAIVLLSIWLREKGSPESKQVASPHTATGR
jgi:hypothetical protein